MKVTRIAAKPVSKTVVCDSSSLISLSESCNLGVLAFLKGKFGADFAIPPSVEKEIVERPSRVGRFTYSAARLHHLLNSGVLRVADPLTLASDAEGILSSANSLFSAEVPLRIIQRGEAECMALLSPLKARALLIDEKTTRLLLEDPKKLLSLMRAEHGAVKADETALGAFKRKYPFTALRSTELVSFAAQNGFFDDFAPDANEIFHASVYALRYAGCAISQKEIGDYQKIRV